MLAIRNTIFGLLVILGLGFAFTHAPSAQAALPGTDATFDPAKWLHPDSDLVIALNLRQIFDSALVKKNGIAVLQQAINMTPVAGDFFKESGMELKDFHSIYVSGPLSKDKDKVQITVKGDFKPERFEKAAASISKNHPQELKIVRDGNNTFYEINVQDMKLFGTFASNKFMVLAATREAALNAAKMGGKADNMTKDLKTAVSRLNANDSFGMGMVVTGEAKAALGQIPQLAKVSDKLKAATKQIQVDKAIDVKVDLQTTDAKAAGDLQLMLQIGKNLIQVFTKDNKDFGPIVELLLKELQLGTNGSSVTLNLRITEELIQKAMNKQ